MSYSVCWLRRQFSWMGRHSGYDLLCDAAAKLIQPESVCHSVWQIPGRPFPRGTGRLIRYFEKQAKSSPYYGLDSTAAELKLLWKNLLVKPQLVHICYVENQLGLTPQWRKYFPGKIIGTVHQPSGWWRLCHGYPETVSALDAIIVVGRDEVAYFEQYLPGRVFYIPHGVDTEFFCPGADRQPQRTARFLFSGKHLRDLDTLSGIVDCVLEENACIEFDILLPKSSRNRHSPTFIRLARHPQVHWHANLSDLELRELYRSATALLLPFLDCTANNALLEGLACGLPVISNDIGNLKAYTDPAFAHLFSVGDIEGMSRAVIELAKNPGRSAHQGNLAREFTEKTLSWRSIAERTVDVYNKVLERPNNIAL